MTEKLQQYRALIGTSDTDTEPLLYSNSRKPTAVN